MDIFSYAGKSAESCGYGDDQSIHADLKCSICSEKLCNHAIQTSYGGKWQCDVCGEISPTNYCLPFYVGKVDFSSDVFGTVCKECHDRHSGKYKMAKKIIVTSCNNCPYCKNNYTDTLAIYTGTSCKHKENKDGSKIYLGGEDLRNIHPRCPLADES